MRRTLRLLALALPLAAVACLGEDPVSPPPDIDIEAIDFAPALGVDLDNSTETSTGLWYRNLVVGTGDTPVAGDSVYVTYTLNLTNGTLFENGKFGFRLDREDVVPGFDQGVEGMREGGRRQLIIPPQLAYGGNQLRSLQTGAIAAPWSVLVFTVTVDSITAITQ